MGGDGSGGVGEVAGGGAADGLKAQFAGAGQGDGNDPVLEGQSRHVDAVVLDVEALQAQTLGEVVCLQQGGEAGADINWIAFDRQKIAVAPDGGGAGFDRGAADAVLDRLVVVDHLEGTEADVLADVAGTGVVGLAAFLAAQPCEGGTNAGARKGCRQVQTLNVELKLAAPIHRSD